MEFILNLLFFSLLPLILFILFLFKLFCFASSPVQEKLPPSPPKLPIVGNLHQLGLLPHRSLHSFSQKYGPLIILHFGSTPVLVASSADTAREIMKNHDLVFSSRPKSSAVYKMLHGVPDIAFAPYGEYWRQVKSVCVLQLLSNKRVQSFRLVREEETSRMIEKIRQKICSSSSLVNLTEMCIGVTNDIIVRITLGRRYSDGEDARKVVEMILRYAEILGVFDIATYIPWLAWVNHFNGLDAKVHKVGKEIDEFLDSAIEEHSNNQKKEVSQNCDNTTEPIGSDFVDILLEVRKETLNSSSPLELDAIKAVIMDMLGAGTDTIHTLLDWAMVELIRKPKILEKLQAEVRQVVQGKSKVTEDDLPRMPYLKAVIKETSRLHCPAPLLVPRESTQDINMMGYNISAGTQVIVNAWAIGRDPNIWDNAEEFQPDRFLNSSIDFRGFHFELIPFGAGRRSCPGISFAIVVIELALARLLHNFNFSLPDGVTPEDIDMTEAAGSIIVSRKLPLHVVVSSYSS